ncbi:MAG: ACP S-malonyltransferase [Myxococcales bacterium]|nr:ACP S-malonyltransferase [Myxococcales bacterium]USN50279.1 MAG: ACP S-malonyltransferase [Myxococcales bacterium]
MSFAYLFPGQGSQSPNMTDWIVKNYSPARQLFSQAQKKLQLNLEKPENLQRSEYCQPTVLLTSYCYFLFCLDNFGFIPSFLCGHSLGEFTALVASKSLDLMDALFLVKARGQLMDAVSQEESGGMLAIINLSLSDVEDYLFNFNKKLQPNNLPLIISSFNSPKEFVVSGNLPLLCAFQETLKKNHIVTMPLKVAGAFHHPMMAIIKDRFSSKLDQITINDPQIKVLSSTTATLLDDAESVRAALESQIDKPVLWITCIEKLLENDNVNCLIDVGPQSILQKSVKDVLAKQVFKLKAIDLISMYSEIGRKKSKALKAEQYIKILDNWLSRLACSKKKNRESSDEVDRISGIYSELLNFIVSLKENNQSDFKDADLEICRNRFIQAMVLKGYTLKEIENNVG